MAEKRNIPHFTAVDLHNYWAGKLSREQMHAIEKAALDDPFLADALEGYKNAMTTDSDLDSLGHKIAKRTGAGTATVIVHKRYHWLKIAASVIVVAGLGLLVQQLVLKDRHATQISKTETGKPNTPRNDTTEAAAVTSAAPGDSFAVKDQSGRSQEQYNSFQKAGNPGSAATITTPTGSNASDRSGKQPPTLPDSKPRQLKETELATAPVTEESEKKGENIKDGNSDKTAAPVAAYNLREANALQKSKSRDGILENAQPMGVAFANKFNYRVVDAQNKPVPFANVMNTRDNVGTYTDIRGIFNLVSADSVMDVQIKSLGYDTATYRLVPSRNVDLVLKEDVEARRQVLAQNRKMVSSLARKDTAELEEPEVGWNYYNTYIANNIQIPENIRAKNARGDVELRFDIDKNGNPVNIKVTRSSECRACDEEAIRLLKAGPRWKKKGRKNQTTISISVDQK